MGDMERQERAIFCRRSRGFQIHVTYRGASMRKMIGCIDRIKEVVKPTLSRVCRGGPRVAAETSAIQEARL